MDCPGCGSFNSVLDTECAECGTPLLAKSGRGAEPVDVRFAESAADEYLAASVAFRAVVTRGQRISGVLMIVGAALTKRDWQTARLSPDYSDRLDVFVSQGA